MNSPGAGGKQQYAHEATYKHWSLTSLVHRVRLRSILRLFADTGMTNGKWADFGCSNGYIIQVVSSRFPGMFSAIHGYDHSEPLLEMARAKKLSNVEFLQVDLNQPVPAAKRYDVVSCFETLEHVGNLPEAFANLFAHVTRGGLLLIAVPVEVGSIGALKYLGRMIVRRRPYAGFFSNRTAYLGYLRALILDDDLSRFRKPARSGWGPHLGFDYRQLRDYIEREYVRSGRLARVREEFTVLRTNALYVYRKLSD